MSRSEDERAGRLLKLLREADKEVYIEPHSDGSDRWLIDGSFTTLSLAVVVNKLTGEG